MDLRSLKEDKLIESLVGFKGKIYYGIPEDTSLYTDPKMTPEEIKNRNINNADLLAILEAGSPIRNLPPRKLLQPVAVKHKDEIMKYFEHIYQAIIEGRNTDVDSLMNELALRMETWTKSFFVEDNGWEPDKPATIHAKNRRAGKPKDAKTTTLIDTASLRGSIRGIYVKNKK